MSEQSPVLLVVDDEPAILTLLRRFGERLGYQVATYASGREALESLRTRRAHAAAVDLHMPEVNGLDVLRAIREVDPACQTILMTGYPSPDSALEAVKLGAVDYLAKPLDLSRLERLLQTVRAQVEQRQQILHSEAELARHLEFCGMVGRSPAMQETFALIRRLAPHLRAGLVRGESGTGKELVARALHHLGPRQEHPFVVATCTADGEAALEAELFGYVAGAVSQTPEGRAGLLELAHNGFVFLDEVANLPLAAQARLVRLLEFGEVHRVGARDRQPVDVVVVAATARDLRAEVSAGRFRSDLFYRLSVVEITLPPLRERREDIPYLTSAFVREIAAGLNKTIRGLTTSAEAVLVAAPWEGNVRELRNVIERACLLTEGESIGEREIAAAMPPSATTSALPGRGGVTAIGDERDLLSTVEREHILRALRRTGGNKKAAARMLGVSRRALYRRLERLDLGATISRRKGQDKDNDHEASA